MPIDTPPFRAAAFGTSDLGTKGGLRTDVDARVLDADDRPIPGLYAAGNTMAAVSGETYPGGGNPMGASSVVQSPCGTAHGAVTMTGVLDGKVAVVAGTSRGVGVGIAHELLRAGATVIGCSRSPLDALPGTSDDPDWTARSSQLVCDQGDYHSIDAFIAEVVAVHGRLDILVNNAGGTVPAPHVEDVPGTRLWNPGRAAQRRRL